MIITEQMIASYRPEGWPALLSFESEGFGTKLLPASFLSYSQDIFREIGDESGDIVALLAFTGSFPSLSPTVEWVAIDHQSGGLACHHPKFVGTYLRLRVEMEQRLRALAKRHFGEGGGHFYTGNLLASDVVAYVDALAALGLHCERGYGLLEESVYPIDATQVHLNMLCENPPDLSLVADKTGYGGLTIVILAENSD
jgi:hypothetical protein